MSLHKSIVKIENLNRQYKVAKSETNLLKSLFCRKYETITAVNDINLDIEEGEIIGLLGRNGAGKSTLIKMLCGILKPTQGTIEVLFRDPFKYRRKNAYQIGVVFGQRSQLWWDLPIGDTFQLLKKLYKISDADYENNLSLFDQHLNLKEIWNQPVRQLSLGQRMRAEIATSILHNPKILLLDEPTIGLDIVVKRQIREFIVALNKLYNTTIIITSHDMKDIEIMCERIIIIDKGRILADDKLSDFQDKYSDVTALTVKYDDKLECMPEFENIQVETDDYYSWTLVFIKQKIQIGNLMSDLTMLGKISDIIIKEKSVEDMVADIYENGKREEGIA